MDTLKNLIKKQIGTFTTTVGPVRANLCNCARRFSRESLVDNARAVKPFIAIIQKRTDDKKLLGNTQVQQLGPGAAVGI